MGHRTTVRLDAPKRLNRTGGHPAGGDGLPVDRLAHGAEIKTIPLTEKFTYDDYLQQQDEQRIALFAIDPAERLYPLTTERDLSPQADWKIIGLSVNTEIGK
ncbi:MAG: hypothetical protein WBG37_03750 [Desulfobacterales bacterium]